jgi:hypothetical protein
LNDTNNPFSPNIGKELNKNIEDIVISEWELARVVMEFDYGLG